MLEQHDTTFEEELEFRSDIFDFVKNNWNCWQRSNLAGHITGSAWVLSPDGSSVLLIHHKKLDRWLQPGGHVDETDQTVADTALREVMEECGLSNLTLAAPVIFDVDVHEIPARGHEPTHFHYDLRFAFRAASMDGGCRWRSWLPKARSNPSGAWHLNQLTKNGWVKSVNRANWRG